MHYTDQASEGVPQTIAIIALQQGIPKSSACVDCIPALYTHRSSLLPIEWLSEIFGLECLNFATGLKCLRIV